MITWMSVDFYTKVLNSCRTLLESVQKPDLETVIDKVVKIYDALMYIYSKIIVMMCFPLPMWACLVSLFATLWTVACQAPLSKGFPRQEH